MKRVIVFLFVCGLLVVGCAGQDKILRNNQDQNKPIKFGSVLALTGKAAVYGEKIKRGFDLAVEEVNNQGGINSRKIEVIYEDSLSDSERSVSATRKLIDINKATILVGYPMSANVVGSAPIAEANKVILFTPVASSGDITELGDYVFRNKETGELHGRVMAEFVYNRGLKRAAVLYVEAPNGLGYKNGLIDEFISLGGEVVYREGYSKDEKDF